MMKSKGVFGFWNCMVAVILLFSSIAMAGEGDFCGQPVDTAQGPVVGMAEKDAAACVYKGIPFASPPTGELRWKPPQPAAERSAVYEAYEFSAECAQIDMIPSLKKSARSEDCLYLNIWRPKKEGKFPVMVWLHGGGFTSGAGSTSLYWGDRLASSKDVVLVSINYRLAAFGFLAHPELSGKDEHGSSGNYGFLDQVAALKWVKENISGFGGDPGNVTIFGQSAGGRSVCFLIASPLSKGLFHKVIMQSGDCSAINTMKEGFINGKIFANRAGCADGNQLDCLRSKSTEEIVEAMDIFAMSRESFLSLKSPKRPWYPHVDNRAFSEAPIESLRSGNYNQVPLMAGSTKDESKLFYAAIPGFRYYRKSKIIKLVIESLGEALLPAFTKLYPFDSYKKPADAFIDAKSDTYFGCNGLEAVEASSQYQPTYYYRYDYDDHRLPDFIGASHGTEIPLVFDNMDRSLRASYSGRQRKKARPMVETMMSYWTSFAHNGEPTDGGSVNWPRYDKDKRSRIYLDLPTKVSPTDNMEKCGFWKEQGIVK